MSSVRQAIELLGLDKRCHGFCRMCDFGIQERFDSKDEGTRRSFVEALGSCNGEDFDNPRPLLGLVVLLNSSEFDQFIARIAQRAPFDGSLAWQIIRLSSNNYSQWFVERGTALFQRQFHLHPTLAPLLLQAVIRPASESQDLIALFDYFEPVAREYPVLRDALPLWNAELERRAQERKAREEKEKAERLRQEERWAARLSAFNVIQYSGPAAIIRALADAPDSSPWDYPENWALISDKNLRCVPRDSLEQALAKISVHAGTRCWRSFGHKTRNALKTLNRSAELAQFEHSPLVEKLQAACDSRWSLTYFPESWADELLQAATGIPVELQTRLLSKLMRLRRRSRWRDIRRRLHSQSNA